MGETWLHINSLLFCHTIDHQQFMVRLINRSQEAIQALHDRIWEVVHQVMESAGRSAVDGIGIALHLMGLLPTIPLQLAFNTVTPEPPRYTPRALTYASQDSIDHGAMSVLGEELIRDPTRGHDQATQAGSCVTTTDTVFTRFTTVKGTGNDCPGPNFSPCSPAYSPSRSHSVPHRSRLTERESNSPKPSMPSLDSSIPDESASDTETSSSDSNGGGRSRPDSPDVVLLGNANDDGPEEDPISLPCFSESDNVEVCVAAVCKKAHQSDVLYAAWLDDQIHTGHDAVKRCDSMVHDHPIPGKRCKTPDFVGPPISYMEERRMFKPAEFVNNLRGLCQFYHTSPRKSNVLVGLRSAESAHQLHHPIPGKCCKTLDFVGPPISYMEEHRMFKPAEFVNADNDGPEEDRISLSCFSESDTVEVCVAAVRKKVHVRVTCCMPPGWTTRSTWATMQSNDVTQWYMTILYHASAAKPLTLLVL